MSGCSKKQKGCYSCAHFLNKTTYCENVALLNPSSDCNDAKHKIPAEPGQAAFALLSSAAEVQLSLLLPPLPNSSGSSRLAAAAAGRSTRW
jgi:hypothetical protein